VSKMSLGKVIAEGFDKMTLEFQSVLGAWDRQEEKVLGPGKDRF